MATLTYLMITSADGYTADSDGDFSWGEPSPVFHRHVETFTRGLAGQIYGPRMWDTMRVWQDITRGDGNDYGELAEEMYQYGETWRALPTHVFSRAEGKPLTQEALRELKAASDGELTIGGPGLAAVALQWGEVDEVARYVVPYATGGGTPWWPLGLSSKLESIAQEDVDGTWSYLRYRVLR